MNIVWKNTTGLARHAKENRRSFAKKCPLSRTHIYIDGKCDCGAVEVKAMKRDDAVKGS